MTGGVPPSSTGRPPAARQASIGSSVDGSTTTCAPIWAATARRFGEKSEAMIVSIPLAESDAMMASPTGPAPTTIAMRPGSIDDSFTACKPTAIGSVSAAIVGSRPFGTGSSA